MQSCSHSLSNHQQTSPMLPTATEKSPHALPHSPKKDNQQREKFLRLLTLQRPQEARDKQVRPTLSLRTLLRT